MIICICNNISDREIQNLRLKYPGLSWEELASKLGLGNNCGTCLQSFVENSDRVAHLPKLKKSNKKSS